MSGYHQPALCRESGSLEKGCDCYTCGHFSAAYLWRLFRAKELLGLRLASIHNLRFVLRLMAGLRKAILEDRLPEFRREFLDAYRPTDQVARQEQKGKWLKARDA